MPVIQFICSRDYDHVYWDSDDPINDNLSVLVIHNIFLGIMILYTQFLFLGIIDPVY